MLEASLLVLALLIGCTPKSPEAAPAPDPEPPAEAPRPSFGPVVHTPVEGMPGVSGHVETVTIGGEELPVRIQVVTTAGQQFGDHTYGQVLSAKGEPLPWPSTYEDAPEGDQVCNVIDFTSLLHNEHGWFHMAHLECAVGGVAVTPLQFAEDGTVTVGTPKLADFSAVGGTTTACAGDITPWNTHLSSEEYEANARLALPSGKLPDEQMSMEEKHPYEWSFLNELEQYVPGVTPYKMGWIPEIRVTSPEADTRVDKHYAMGRFSHELGLVMPDGRTVYLSDDQYHGGWFMFVADRKADLSAGTLYAARWNQKSDTEMDLDWISLGHSTDAAIEKAISDRIQFSELMEAAELSEDNTCPEGFGRATTSWGTECLKTLQPELASRLETRRYAALLGATTELTKSEGIALDPGDGTPESSRLYMATSTIKGSMLEEQSDSRGPGDYRRTEETDHLRLPENRCGIVWEMTPGEAKDRDGEAIDSPYVVRTATARVVGKPEGEVCSEETISNPDNITFVEDYGWLLMAEDTRYHQADTLWALDMRDPDARPVRLIEVAAESEVTGIHWFHVDGKGFLTFSNQWDPDAYHIQHSVAALLGPFPLP